LPSFGWLSAEAATLSKADDAEERTRLLAEQAELEDRKTLAAERARLVTRRDLLKDAGLYDDALIRLIL
jgi:hypothetical protein